MAATADTARATLPVIATEAGRKAKAMVLNHAQRRGAAIGNYRCTACGGRCEVRVTYKRGGAIKSSQGQCRTPGCIAWED